MATLGEMIAKEGKATVEVMHYAKSMWWIMEQANDMERKFRKHKDCAWERIELLAWIYEQMLAAEERVHQGPKAMQAWAVENDMFNRSLSGEFRVTGKDTVAKLHRHFAHKFLYMYHG